uniref:Pro-apoptotic WT1 regulator n=1 Tax=Nothobranchius furzeri TaxID=105023 RepID=A0A8C6P2X9_NOTFU
MATGGFKSNPTTNILEEWKAKREKVRAKMLGDIAAATGVPLSPSANNRLGAPPGADLTGSPDWSASAANCHTPSCPGVAPSRPEEDAHHPAAPSAPASNLKKAPPQPDKAPGASPDSSLMACNASDKESPSPSKGKEKKSSGPSARKGKGKGQIEKRKLREKRRSTGVVNIPSNESLDELDDDDDAGVKDRRDEDELVLANTFHNEAMTADPAAGYILLCSTGVRGGGGWEQPTATPPSRQRWRTWRSGEKAGGAGEASQTAIINKELAWERQENARMLKDKDDLIGKLKEEIDLLNRDPPRITINVNEMIWATSKKRPLNKDKGFTLTWTTSKMRTSSSSRRTRPC